MPSAFKKNPALAVYTAFFLYAAAIGGIFPRLGDIQRALGIAERELGWALIGTSVGTLVSLTCSGRWVEGIGHRTTVLLMPPAIALCFAVASLSTSPIILFAALMPAGLCIGALEIVVNLEADRVEHQLGRPIMSRAHACWSLGFFAASLSGGWLAQRGWNVQWHLAAMTLVIAGLAVLLLARFDPAANRPSDLQADGAQPRHAWPTRGTLILVVACLSAMVLEGAGAEWSAIYMRDTFAASPFVAGAAIASGAGFQAVTRWWAGGAIDRFGPVKVGRALHMVLATGGLLVFLAEHPAVAMAGFALMGIGTSAIFPMAMSAAAQATDRAAALNVAALAQTAFIAFLVGPPLLGSVATQWGIRWSYGITLPLVLLGFWATKALDPKTR